MNACLYQWACIHKPEVDSHEEFIHLPRCIIDRRCTPASNTGKATAASHLPRCIIDRRCTPPPPHPPRFFVRQHGTPARLLGMPTALTLAVALTMTLALVGCGGSSADTPTTTTTTTAKAPSFTNLEDRTLNVNSPASIVFVNTGDAPQAGGCTAAPLPAGLMAG
ncbi:MAG: hypothetical protein K0U66_02570, partial [Gammaproteobacteria bacterium]|nr:hypothetical protein [Gammaproteobacteria bacterium]